jgi:uncharacterized protein
MEIVKIPSMEQSEYESLVKEHFRCLIAFKGGTYPYLAPFLYVVHQGHLYFLSTNYGAKIQYFHENPLVAVEIEKGTADLSEYAFVLLFGRLVEVQEVEEKRAVRKAFVQLIAARKLSKNILAALGHSPHDSLEALEQEGITLVWKLVDVAEPRGLKGLEP